MPLDAAEQDSFCRSGCLVATVLTGGAHEPSTRCAKIQSTGRNDRRRVFRKSSRPGWRPSRDGQERTGIASRLRLLAADALAGMLEVCDRQGGSFSPVPACSGI